VIQQRRERHILESSDNLIRRIGGEISHAAPALESECFDVSDGAVRDVETHDLVRLPGVIRDVRSIQDRPVRQFDERAVSGIGDGSR
jgi:hypothetical protein